MKGKHVFSGDLDLYRSWGLGLSALSAVYLVIQADSTSIVSLSHPGTPVVTPVTQNPRGPLVVVHF